MILPSMKRPCNRCPFRKDTLEGWLGEQRMAGILSVDTFVCHKKTDKQCAGHTLIKGKENTFVALADKLNLDTQLGGQELVFDTKQECIDHHARV
jgi:hypothetical protein